MSMKRNLGVVIFVLASIFLQLAAVQDTAEPSTNLRKQEKRRPLRLRVTDFDYKTISIEWDPPMIDNITDVLSYQVNYRIDYNLPPLNSQENPWSHSRTVDGNDTSFLVKGLEPGTKYSICVSAAFNDGEETQSSVVKHQTKGFGINNPCDCSKAGIDKSQALSETCDFITGHCKCKNKFYRGERCDQCHVTYAWVSDNVGCIKCACPDDGIRSNGECYPDGNHALLCKCLFPYQGVKCDLCEKGHFKDSKGMCHKCECNGNEDPNVDNACDAKGMCVQCGYNTDGENCEKCAHGYSGDALLRNCTRIAGTADEIRDVTAYRHGSNINLILGVSIPLLIFVIIVICSVVVCKQARDRNKPLKLWTISLQDERVNFSSQMEDGLVGSQLLKDDVKPYSDLTDPIS